MTQQELFAALLGALALHSLLRYCASITMTALAMRALKRAREQQPDSVKEIEEYVLEPLVNEHDKRLCSLEAIASVRWNDERECHELVVR